MELSRIPPRLASPRSTANSRYPLGYIHALTDSSLSPFFFFFFWFFCFSILFIKICFLCWKDLEIAVVKATNHVECPPKERHVRSEPFSFVFRVFMQEIFDIFENLDLYRTMLQITIWVGLVFFFFFFSYYFCHDFLIQMSSWVFACQIVLNIN
jgi:hypothetical protein